MRREEDVARAEKRSRGESICPQGCQTAEEEEWRWLKERIVVECVGVKAE